MKNGEQTREAVGSSHSYPRGRQRRKAFSASHPQHPNERSQLSPYGTESEEIRARIYLRSEQPQLSPYGTESEEIRARIYLESEQPQALTRRMSELSTNQQGQIEHSQEDSFTSAQQLKKKASTISDEWDMLERDDIDSPTTLSSLPPTYDFPGTWPTALQDTTAALTSVTAATTSYAEALTRSGIGKAGWSVGAALASTANKRALYLVNWAVDSTGTGVDQLPRPISGWLRSGRERWRKERKARGGKEDVMFGDERGMFVLQTAEMDHTGEFVSGLRAVDEKGWAEADVEGGSMVEEMGEERREDDEAERDGEDDGMVRLFEFDD